MDQDVLLSLIVLGAAYALSCIYIVPGFHFAQRYFLGKPRRGVHLSGPHWHWFGFERIEFVNMQRTPKQFEITLPGDTIVIVRGALEYSPDPTVQRDGVSVFMSLSEEEFSQGIELRITGDLGEIVAFMKDDDFEATQFASALYLNATFRLETPPHLDHDRLHCGVPRCKFGTSVPREKVIEFYTKHEAFVVEELRRENAYPDSRSRLEGDYGIEAKNLEFNIRYPPETEDAKQDAQQAKLRAKTQKDVLDYADKFIQRGVNPNNAANLAAHEMTLNSRRTVVAFEGLGGGGLASDIVGGIAGGNIAARESADEPKATDDEAETKKNSKRRK